MQKKDKISLIENFKINGDGFHPFMISDGWQVAQLNYMKEQHINNINKVDVHYQTDEVFVLLEGKAVLIAVVFEGDSPIFEIELMKKNETYNIPKNMWHNIAMEKGSKVLIVEKANTHLADYEFKYLSESVLAEMKSKVEQILNT